MNLEHRTQALLALVDAFRERRCAEILAPARAQAQEMVATALADGRRRVRATIAEARARMAADVGAAQARLATERRLAQQQHALALLAQGWQVLRIELHAHWQGAAARRGWTASATQRALAALPHGVPWQIACAPDWPAAERAEFAQTLAARGIAIEAMAEDPAIACGLRLRAGANVLDATVDGLLADRAGLQGRLLQLLSEEAR
ncbi:MAG: hypothetical protein ACK5RK_10460 [Betaproteobacteria bacterium]